MNTQTIKEDKEPTKSYVASKEEAKAVSFLTKRIEELQSYKKDQKIEETWNEADNEYIPSDLKTTSAGKRFETDQDTGLRSRMVRIGDDKDNWRSSISQPTLLGKIQTALSIIIDRNPEATLTAMSKKYEKRSALANGIWKRNWEITKAKEKLKLLVFDCAKYGWAAGRTFPQKIKYKKKILKDIVNGEKVYETVENVLFNDVNRQRLDPKRVWIDEMTRPYDTLSMNDVYYELDYSYDLAKLESEEYDNFKYVGKSAKQEVDSESEQDKKESSKERKDIITFGFYENKLKDLYIIWIPSKKIILNVSPLPNDDGYLSIWHFPWILKSSSSPYGISLWEMIKGNKGLYDKMNNMTMDQLVLSIFKMFFFSGTSGVFGDGNIKIEPGKGQQLTGGGKVDWMNVPGPGQEAWEGLKHLKAEIDTDSGITPTLDSELTGKTLGEVLHAKEAALKKLKVPVENISWGIEQDAYITLSWSKQVLSTPEIKEFATTTELKEYEEEEQISHDELFGKVGEDGGFESLKASFLPEVSLHLEDRDGELFESKETRYFQVGKDIDAKDLDWKGIFKVVTKSLLAPSEELEAQRKSQMYNLLVPILPNDPRIFSKSAIQLIKLNGEDPKDWLPDEWLAMTDSNKGKELFVQDQGMGTIGGAPMNSTDPRSQQTMQGNQGVKPNPGGPTVVPGNQMSRESQNQFIK